MLTNFNEMLKKAAIEGYAIGSFNGYNYETIRGIVEAGNDLGCDGIIVAFGKKYLKNMDLSDVFSVTSSIASRTDMDVCLHLDHCDDISIIQQAINSGFTSVMYDGSMLPFELNLKNTRQVCEMAHSVGVSVEAELGSIAAGEHSHEGKSDDLEIYTDPWQAELFVNETGVDALAVSIGTVHGLYKGVPNIRVDILKVIAEKVKIPLVMHGGSGVPEKTITECIKNGIRKINVNTEISVYAVDKIAEVFSKGGRPHLSVLGAMTERNVREVVSKYIRFFGQKPTDV
ncbi:MAG: class II fructose-bisphosphate aldolase [Eubacteriales bacterium]|jgi:fructose-bisphosphate aldolase class II